MTDIRQNGQLLPDFYGDAMRAYDHGREMARENGLAKLSKQYFEQGSSPQLLGEIARYGGDAVGLQKLARQDIHEQAMEAGNYAKMFLALPPEQKQAAYPALVAKVNALKMDHPPIPDQYNPQFDQGIAKFAEALGAQTGEAMPAEVTAFREMTRNLNPQDAQRAQRIALGLDPRASSGLPFAPGSVTGSDGRERMYRFDKRTGQLELVDQAANAPPMPSQPPTMGAGIALDDQTLQSLMSVPAGERATLLAAMQGGGQTFHPGPNGQPVSGPSAGSAFVSPTPGEVKYQEAYAGERGRQQGEKDATVPQRQQGMEGTLRGISETMDSIDRAIAQVPGFGTTGLAGKISGAVPGTPAYNLRQTMASVKANLGFDRLQAMREASPTGGALGQVAVQELEFLQAAVASLDQGQDDAQLLANLKKVRTHYQRWSDAVQKAGQRTGLQVQPQKSTAVEWVRGPDGKLRRK